MHPLPFELHAMIVESIFRLSQSNYGVEYATLAACCITCKAWTPIAQRYLYRCLPLRPTHNYGIPDFLRAIQGDVYLGTYVRSLAIGEAEWFYSFDDDDPGRPRAADLYTLLSLCPHIAKITFFSSISWKSALEYLCPLNLQLIALELFDHGPADIFEALQTWPSVRFISLADIAIYGLELALMPPPLAGALLGVEMPYTTPDNYMAWLLSSGNNKAPLLEVSLRGWMVHGETVDAVSTLGGSRVRSLACFAVPHSSVLGRFTALEEFVFEELPMAPLALPRSLKHVGYHPDDSYPGRVPGSDTEIVEHARHLIAEMSALRSLQLVTATRKASPEIRALLANACRSLGVEFVVFTNAASVPYARHVDWI